MGSTTTRREGKVESFTYATSLEHDVLQILEKGRGKRLIEMRPSINVEQ